MPVRVYMIGDGLYNAFCTDILCTFMKKAGVEARTELRDRYCEIHVLHGIPKRFQKGLYIYEKAFTILFLSAYHVACSHSGDERHGVGC